MVPIHKLDTVELFFNQYTILINFTVIHRFGVVGGMSGGARMGGGSSIESMCNMIFILLEIQLFGILNPMSGYLCSGCCLTVELLMR